MTAATEPLLSSDPAVTDAFPRAAGLQDLVSTSAPTTAAPSTTPPPPKAPEVPAVEFGPKLFLNSLRLLDRLASRALKVEPEPDNVVEELAGAIAPLVQYYGRTNSTVSALWGNLILTLVGVTYAKVEKVKARQPQQEEVSSHGTAQ